MHCLECDQDGVLHAEITIKKTAALAAHRGTIKTGGVKVSQIDLKTAWDKEEDGSDKLIRGPIVCSNCFTEHVYVAGCKPSPLLKITHAQALEIGHEALLAGTRP